jgi:hypothetical protein
MTDLAVVVHFCDVALAFMPVLRYLGVWRTLSFSAHLVKVHAKGWRALSSVRRPAGRTVAGVSLLSR